MSQQHNPPHPGEVLKDGVFTGGNLTIKTFAERIGVTRAALEGSAESWLHMQANYDLWQARQKPRKEIARLEIHA